MHSTRYRWMVYAAMLAAQAVVIGIIESMIPSPFAFAPGAKLGLANLVTIISLFTLPVSYSFQVVMIRLVVSTLIGGTLSTFFYSLAGGLLSYFGMLLMKQLGPDRVSIIGISTFGGVLHNIGQLVTAGFFAKTWAVFIYLPILGLSGLLAGLAVGIAGNYLLTHLSVLRIYHDELIKRNKEASWLQNNKPS